MCWSAVLLPFKAGALLCTGCKTACKVRPKLSNQQQLQHLHSCMAANSYTHTDPRSHCCNSQTAWSNCKAGDKAEGLPAIWVA